MEDPRERFPDIDIHTEEAEYIMEFETATGWTIIDRNTMRFCVYILRMPQESSIKLVSMIADAKPN